MAEDGRSMAKPFLVCTGGEPLLQLDGKLVEAFHEEGFDIAIETNGREFLRPVWIGFVSVQKLERS